ncbi:MAG TPA: response regulator [Rudaea sp.]
MNATDPLPPVLLADDDPDDRSLTGEAFRSAALPNPLHYVTDGEKLLDYLRECQRTSAPNCMPALILLDLNMPRIDGREALQTIKRDPSFRAIPVVVWTTSRAAEDRQRAQDAGCDGYVTKPSSFVEMVELMRSIGERWLPQDREATGADT